VALQLTRFSEDTGRYSYTKTTVVQGAIAAAKYLQGHVLLREALQNSCDSKDPSENSIGFRVSFGEFSHSATETLKAQVFAGAKTDMLPEIASFLGQETRTYLAISDTKTSGLDGGTNRGVKIEEFGNFLKFFFVYGENDDKAKSHGGGSAGVGRTIFTNSSVCNTILVFSRVAMGSTSELRMMGYTNGNQVSLEGKTFTGRHWWGLSQNEDPNPITNDDALDLAISLGLENELPIENGTLIIILGPSFNDRESSADLVTQGELLFDEMWESSLLFAWPHLVDETVEFQFVKNGLGIPLPAIDAVPGIRSFVSAYRKLQSEDKNEIVVGKRQLIMGHISRSVTLRDEADEWFTNEVSGSAVALMRRARFVVKYLQVDNPADGGFSRGVFLSADGEPDALFRRSEPAAHDDWLPAKLELPSGTPNYVKLTLQRIVEAFKTKTTDAVGVGSDHAANSLSKIFGLELISEGTWGPSPDPDPPGGGGGTGGGGLAKKAKLTELGDVQIVSLQDGYVTSKFRFSMEGSPPSNGQVQVKFSAKVLQSDGAFEESAPINQGKPQVLSVTGPIGSTESDTIRISSENWTGELAVLVKAPIECAVVCLDEIDVSAAVKP
jgi:hypothetical protein